MYQAFTFIHFLVALTAAPRLATASPVQLPRSLKNVPSGTKALAFDPESGSIFAYAHDGTFLGHVNQTSAVASRADGTCTTLGPNDLTGLAGWGLVTAQAAANWGNVKYNLATNINGDAWGNFEADYPAIACVSDETAMVIGPVLHYLHSDELRDVETSDWSLGLSVAATIGIPDIVDTTTTVSTSISITNSLSNAVTTTSNNQQTQSITMSAADGATCSLTFTSKSCTGSGTGSIVMTAKGWAWFEYTKKWALLLGTQHTYIPDASQRSSSIDFTAAISATDDSQYKGTCS
ncbi:hypothetical protein B0H13DRAFT_2305001 [Mycena leptocephala]|nr:hypothetical protein B0H13DRAFT_2305001 [Mycena leptocephala]